MPRQNLLLLLLLVKLIKKHIKTSAREKGWQATLVYKLAVDDVRGQYVRQ